MKIISGVVNCSNPYPQSYQFRESASSLSVALKRAFNKIKKEKIGRARIKRYIITFDVL
mgnify:CR=1